MTLRLVERLSSRFAQQRWCTAHIATLGSVDTTIKHVSMRNNVVFGCRCNSTGSIPKYGKKTSKSRTKYGTNTSKRNSIAKDNINKQSATTTLVVNKYGLPDLIVPNTATEQEESNTLEDKRKMNPRAKPALDAQTVLQEMMQNIEETGRSLPQALRNEVQRILKSPVLRQSSKQTICKEIISLCRSGQAVAMESRFKDARTKTKLLNPSEKAQYMKSLQALDIGSPAVGNSIETVSEKASHLAELNINSTGSLLNLIQKTSGTKCCSGCGSDFQQTSREVSGYIANDYVDSYLRKHEKVKSLLGKSELNPSEARLLKKGFPELLCERCYKIRYYNKDTVDIVQPNLDRTLDMVKKCNPNMKDNVIYHVVSALDFPATVNWELMRDFVLSKSDYTLVLVVNKFDVRPRTMTVETFQTYIRNIFKAFIETPKELMNKNAVRLPLKPDGMPNLDSDIFASDVNGSLLKALNSRLKIIFASAETNNVRKLAEDIRERRIVGKSTFLVGYTNVGKSSLINAIGTLHGVPQSALPVVMPSVGTTAQPVKVNMPLTRVFTQREIKQRLKTLPVSTKPLVEQVAEVTEQLEKEDKEHLLSVRKNAKSSVLETIRSDPTMVAPKEAESNTVDLNDMDTVKAGGFYDMPGWDMSNSLTNYLPLRTMISLVPKYGIPKVQKMVRPGESLIILGLLRIDVEPLSKKEIDAQIEVKMRTVPGVYDLDEKEYSILRKKLYNAVLTDNAVYMFSFVNGAVTDFWCPTKYADKYMKMAFSQLTSHSDCKEFSRIEAPDSRSRGKYGNGTYNIYELLALERYAMSNLEKLVRLGRSVRPIFSYQLPKPSVALYNTRTKRGRRMVAGNFTGSSTGVDIVLGGFGFVSIPMQKSCAKIRVYGPDIKTIPQDVSEEIYNGYMDHLYNNLEANKDGIRELDTIYGMVRPTAVDNSTIFVRPPIPFDNRVPRSNPVKTLKDIRRDIRRKRKAMKAALAQLGIKDQRIERRNRHNVIGEEQHLAKKEENDNTVGATKEDGEVLYFEVQPPSRKERRKIRRATSNSGRKARVRTILEKYRHAVHSTQQDSKSILDCLD